MDYTIKRGDTLTKIAKQYGTTVAELARLNNIKNVNVIFEGKSLKIKDNAAPMNTFDAMGMLNDAQKSSAQQLPVIESQNITEDPVNPDEIAAAIINEEDNVENAKPKETLQTNIYTKDNNPPKTLSAQDNQNIIPYERTNDANNRPIRITSRSFDGSVNSYTDFEYPDNGNTIETRRDANGDLIIYIERDKEGIPTKTIKPAADGFEEKLLRKSGSMSALIRRNSAGEMISKLNYEPILDMENKIIGSRLVSTENTEGTTFQKDDNYKPVIDQNGNRTGWVRVQPKINDPRFQGLEDYEFKAHGSKDGIGEFIVNGEKVIIDRSDESKFVLYRTNADNNGFENLEYKSLDELNKALQNKELQWGRTAGKGYQDVFIP